MWLPQLRDERISCIFSDQPDNLGLDYGDGGKGDRLSTEEYTAKLWTWVSLFINHADTTWLSFNAKWTLEMARVVRTAMEANPDLKFKPCVQTFTFGQNCKTDLGNGHRPLWRLRWKHAKLYPDQVKVPSWRQLNGDKRAAPGGRVPLDVFDFPRVTGNSKQRRSYHPTQLHEDLVERAIKLVTKPGDLVCDPFLGTGTTLRVCRRIGRQCIGIEKSPVYCQHIADEHGMYQRETGKYSRWWLDNQDGIG
jgi:hypothetical protein